MSVRAFLEPTAKFATGLAAFVCIPAIVSLLSAVWSAATTGEVMVISIGRYETAREMVPWVAGWSRFVGPLLLVASLGGGVSSSKQIRWWISAALALAGVCLLFFSMWFRSLGGAIAFTSLLAFVGVTFYIDGRWGRPAAFALIVLAVGTLLYVYAA